MIKNNIKSLLIHILISILSLIAYAPFHVSAVKWVSREAAKNHHIFMLILGVSIIILALILYYFLSRAFLINQGSDFKNIVSVSLTVLIGLILWLTAYNFDYAGETSKLLNSDLWQLYSFYYSYCLSFVDEAAIKTPFIMFIFCIIPFLVMWLAIKDNGKSNR